MIRDHILGPVFSGSAVSSGLTTPDCPLCGVPLGPIEPGDNCPHCAAPRCARDDARNSIRSARSVPYICHATFFVLAVGLSRLCVASADLLSATTMIAILTAIPFGISLLLVVLLSRPRNITQALLASLPSVLIVTVLLCEIYASVASSRSSTAGVAIVLSPIYTVPAALIGFSVGWILMMASRSFRNRC